MSDAGVDEKKRSALVALGDNIGEMAMQGQIVAAVMIYHTSEGAIQVSVTNLDTVSTIGSLQVGLNLMIGKALNGGRNG